jgi:hypothetical protein
MRRQVTKKTDLRNNRGSFRLKLAAPGSGKRRTSKRLVAISVVGWKVGGDGPTVPIRLVRAVVGRFRSSLMQSVPIERLP